MLVLPSLSSSCFRSLLRSSNSLRKANAAAVFVRSEMSASFKEYFCHLCGLILKNVYKLKTNKKLWNMYKQTE